MNIDEAKEYLIKHNKPEYQHYIRYHLAADFAVTIAEEHERLVTQLRAELKWRNDNSND